MVKPQALHGARKRDVQQPISFWNQHLKLFRFSGAEPPTCVRQTPLAIESETGPFPVILSGDGSVSPE